MFNFRISSRHSLMKILKEVKTLNDYTTGTSKFIYKTKTFPFMTGWYMYMYHIGMFINF